VYSEKMADKPDKKNYFEDVSDMMAHTFCSTYFGTLFDKIVELNYWSSKNYNTIDV